MQTNKPALQLILQELKRAKNKWPKWVDDPIHAAGILNEESGELMQACLDFSYSDKPVDYMIFEAAQVGAMAIRFLEGIEKYKNINRNI